jgi:hypothetical protein
MAIFVAWCISTWCTELLKVLHLRPRYHEQMSRIGRRGFFQMVGLGAVGSLASIPLFSVGGSLLESGGLLADGPVDLLAGHLVVERAFVEGVAYTIDGSGYGQGVSFRSKSDGGLITPEELRTGRRFRVDKDDVVLDAEETALALITAVKKDRDVAQREVGTLIASPRLAMTRGRVSLEPSDRMEERGPRGEYVASGPPLADVELVEGTDPLLRFYEIAQRLREQIRDKAVQALNRWPEKFRRHGVQIVTVVESPLAGHVIPSEGQTVSTEVLRSLKGRPPPPRLIVTASYEHWLVQGKVEAMGVYSTAGEYPVDDELDLERLVWIDERVRDGRIILA